MSQPRASKENIPGARANRACRERIYPGRCQKAKRTNLTRGIATTAPEMWNRKYGIRLHPPK
eukprot:680347-Prorocentrum_minimum.AAC.1